MNTGKTPEAKGAGCAKNDWMYQSLRDAITKFDCDVYVCENAPALATNKGRPVADKLFAVAKEYGYSLAIYKTSTMYHGIPQNRDRTFAIAFKKSTSPVLSWYNRDRLNLKQFLAEVDSDLLQQDVVINEDVADEPYYNFIKYYTKENPRKVMAESGHVTAFNYVNKNGLLKTANQWFINTNNEKGIKYSNHALFKISQGLGIWDGSVHYFDEVINSIIGRNLVDSIHPVEDRSLTIREAFRLMGFPDDFELVGGRPKVNQICQNIPVCTARDIVLEAIKFLQGKLPDSGCDYFWQNNHNETTDTSRATNLIDNSLEEFFGEAA